MAAKFYDTCSLLLLQERAFREPFFLSDITLRELDNIKSSPNKSHDLQSKARKIGKLLDQHPDTYRIIVWRPTMSKGYSDTNDMHIIECAQDCAKKFQTVFVTDDIAAKNIARKVFDLAVESVGDQTNEIYKGYRSISGNTSEINEYMNSIDYSQWHTNEYLIIKNTEDGSTGEMRFDGRQFVALKLPPSRHAKGKNSLQRCALDAMLNPTITAVALLGGYGSGKTYLSMRMALHHIEAGTHGKILGVREPRGEGADIGYLPGSMDDKTENFFLPLVQQLDGGEIQLERLKAEGAIESIVPYYLKGTTYNDTIIVVDEAEDLTRRQIKLIGTRVGKNSKIFLSGDYKQSIVNSSECNALVKMCDDLKGDPKFACVYLGEDVRSETSKMFSTLFCE